MKEQCIGVDFGTSNTSAATSTENGETFLYPLQNNSTTQPSGIFIDEKGHHSVGFEAIDDFLIADQKNESSHYVPSIKDGLPIPDYEGIKLTSHKIKDGRFPTTFYETETMASYIFNDVIKHVEKYGEISKRVVVGRPVKFSSNPQYDAIAQNRLETAAKLAGFEEIHFILEPIAAALHYERYRLNSPKKTVFVFDFGGGTLDTCILNLGSGVKSAEKVIASYGVSLGGTDLDKDIFRKTLLQYFGSQVTFGPKKSNVPYYVYEELPDWQIRTQSMSNGEVIKDFRTIKNDEYCSDKDAINRLMSLIEYQQVPAVLNSIEIAKIDLSSTEKASIEYKSQTLQFEQEIDRMKYSNIVQSRMDEIKACIDECLALAGISKQKIDIALKVGGSSKNNFIDTILQTYFANIEDATELTTVAAGLGLIASELS